MRYPTNYVNIKQGFHQGKSLDFGWGSNYGGPNVPIYACEEGKILATENQKKGGNVIFIEHNDGKVSCYGHLSKILVKKGDKVKLGQQIGNMGDTGIATGPHLHFGLYSNKSIKYGDSDIDPFKYLELYDGQIVKEDTQKEYGTKIKKHNEKTEPISKYSKGRYIMDNPRYIRTGAGTEYPIKKVKDVTANAKTKVVNSNLNANAQLKKGATFDVSEVKYASNKSIWGKIPSGWVCLESSLGTAYVKKG